MNSSMILKPYIYKKKKYAFMFYKKKIILQVHRDKGNDSTSLVPE